MADFDPFANQGGQAAWDPEHSADVKKQAEELSRRLAADIDGSGNEPSRFSDHGSPADDDPDVENDELPDGTA